jgi:hypothetical protein
MNALIMIRFACISILFVSASLQAAEPMRVTFSGVPGPYTVERWKTDWPGCEFEDGVKEGNLSVMEQDARKWLRVSYVTGQIGPEKNGAGWRFPIGRVRLTVTLACGRRRSRGETLQRAIQRTTRSV